MPRRLLNALSAGSVSQAAAVLIAGTLVSRLGDGLATLGLVLHAADGGIGWGVTEVFLADLIPPIIAAPFIGALADRVNARVTWFCALVIQAAALGTAASVESFHLRVGLISLSSLVGVASTSAGFKLLPLVAGAGKTAQANSLLTAGMAVAGLLGPALGGFLYESIGPTAMLWIDSVSFLLLALCTVLAVPAVVIPVAASRNRTKSRVSDGFRVLRHAPVMGPLLPTLSAVMLGTSIEGVAGVFYLRQIANDNHALYGLFLATWALGSIPGALLASRAFSGIRQSFPIVAGALAVSLGLLAAGVFPVTAVIFAAFLMGGLGNGVLSASVRSAVHEHVSPGLHGSAWACYSAIANCCVGFGYLLGTPNELLSSRALVIVAGVLPLPFIFWCVSRVLPGIPRRTDKNTKQQGLRLNPPCDS